MFYSRTISSSEKIIEEKPTLGEIEKTTTNFKKSLTFSQVMKKVFIYLIILIILSWLGLGIKKIISPPYLTIIQPSDNLIIKEDSLKIIGKTEKEAQVFINNQLVSYNKEGHFEETISLRPGLNELKISASRGEGRERVEWRRVMVLE